MTAEELQVIITAKTEGLRREMDGVKKRMDAMEKQSNGVQSKMSSMFSGIKKAMVAAGLAVLWIVIYILFMNWKKKR